MGLLSMFGPSRTEVWRELSAAIGGDYSERSWPRRPRVDAAHAHWTITLDVFVVSTGKTAVPFTRLRAPFVATGAFRCKLYRKNLFSALGRLFGRQDVTVGDDEFDRAFVVKGNDERMVRELCASEPVRRLLLAQKWFQVSVVDNEGWLGPKFPPDTDELRVVVRGILKDTERLRSLFDLCKATLDQLHEIGASRARKPTLKL